MRPIRELVRASVLVLSVTCALTGVTHAQDSDASTPEAVDPRVAAVRALSSGELEVDIDPQSLFDVAVDDEVAIEIERARVAALLNSLDATSRVPPTNVDAGSALDPARWRSRLELDRARLAFYALSSERRQALLAEHTARRTAARPLEREADDLARQAEQARERARRAAQEARSEAERLVAEELARLLALQRSLATLRQRFADQQVELAGRVDRVLGWQRRVREVKRGPAENADASYDALRATLRVARDELSSALDLLAGAPSEVPALGKDETLQRIPVEIATGELRARRASAARDVELTRAQETALRDQQASVLLDETNALNQERLGLLPYLSADKRVAITGLTAAGWDQARAEARHLMLILRYHRHVAVRWAERVRARQGLESFSFLRLLAGSVPWWLMVGAFVWWRRRSAALVALIERRCVEQDRHERRTAPSAALQVVRFLRGIERPLSWLLFFWLALWLLPAGAQGLLEVQLLTAVVGWSLAASLIVNAINALAALTSTQLERAADDSNELRLRSLRLVGRVVVVLALVLLLSARLVGEGTVYHWVLSSCWLAALPVFLVLVRWWRETVFVRLERVRRKSTLQSWMLSHRAGWQSFFAAMIAAIQLFASGALKTAQRWLSGFTLTRRADAYFFKRELDRLASEDVRRDVKPLRAEGHQALAPDRASASWIACAADPVLASLAKRAASGQGGLVAVIGARGAGKSFLLERLVREQPRSLLVPCQAESLLPGLRERLTDQPALIVIDDAHRLIKPVLGGLRTIDALLAFAREPAAQRALWVLAIDALVWPYLRRARDDRPLFDELYELPQWTDEQLGTLLWERSRQAAMEPSFEGLLERMPRGADEIDRQEALAAKRAGYMRVVWDYARGNPAIALEVWRSSLVEDEQGVRVRPLQVPPVSVLERLPDSTLFILRAVLQMAPASCEDVAQATRLSEGQVQDAFRFGRHHGYLCEHAGRVWVSWAWLRTVLIALERRHLVVLS
jgi:hypothetical protein